MFHLDLSLFRLLSVPTIALLLPLHLIVWYIERGRLGKQNFTLHINAHL